jgi:hypothetical protein
LGINFQSGLKIPFLLIRFFGNERRSVPRLQLHLGDIAYKFVVLYLFYYISASFILDFGLPTPFNVVLDFAFKPVVLYAWLTNQTHVEYYS